MLISFGSTFSLVYFVIGGQNPTNFLAMRTKQNQIQSRLSWETFSSTRLFVHYFVALSIIIRVRKFH